MRYYLVENKNYKHWFDCRRQIFLAKNETEALERARESEDFENDDILEVPEYTPVETKDADREVEYVNIVCNKIYREAKAMFHSASIDTDTMRKQLFG